MKKLVTALFVIACLHFGGAMLESKYALLPPLEHALFFSTSLFSVGLAVVGLFALLAVNHTPLVVGDRSINAEANPKFYWTLILLGTAFGAWLMVQTVYYVFII